MRGTTTQGQRPPRQRHIDNTTPHRTTQPTTTRDTRRDTAPHNKKKDTHVHAHVHVCVYAHVGVHVHVGVTFCSFLTKKKTQSGTRTSNDVYCSKPFDLPQWLKVPFLPTKCGPISHSGKNCKSKMIIPPGSKTATVQLLKKNSTGARN